MKLEGGCYCGQMRYVAEGDPTTAAAASSAGLHVSFAPNETVDFFFDIAGG